MTEYFDEVDTSLPFSRNRSRIINGVERFVQDEYGAETSQLNLNAWKLRFDVDVESKSELENLVRNVNELVENECPFECSLAWEYIPTDKKGQKDGFYAADWSDSELGPIGESRFPIEAFRVTIPREF